MADSKNSHIKQDFLSIFILSLFLVLLIATQNHEYVQYILWALGPPFVLFCPGYTLLAALLPKKTSLDSIERTALSIGLSITMVSLIGLLLHYTSRGIGLVSILSWSILFVIVMLIIAWRRRYTISRENAFVPIFHFNWPALNKLTWTEWILSLLLILSLLTAVGSIIYAITIPNEKFTEFYILGPDGKADGYPTVLVLGQQSQVLAGVVNHENGPVQYIIQVKMGNDVTATSQPISLENGQMWEAPVTFEANVPEQDLEVDFLLFREGDTLPYRSLRLWVNALAVPTITIRPSDLRAASVRLPYKVTFSAVGGTGPYAFYEKGAIPRGMAFSGNTLSGRPAATGRYPIVIIATDQKGLTRDLNCILTVTPSA